VVWFDEFQRDSTNFCNPPTVSDRPTRKTWFQKRIIAFSLARLGWDVFDTNQSTAISTLLSENNGPPVFWRNGLAVAEIDERRINSPEGEVKLIDENRDIVPIYSTGVGLELARDYVDRLIKMVRSGKTCDENLSTESQEAIRILKQVSSATKQFVSHPLNSFKTFEDRIKKDLRRSLESIAYDRRLYQKALEEYSKLLLAKNVAPGRYGGEDFKDLLCYERGTVLEGLNEPFVGGLHESGFVLCIEISAVRDEDKPNSIPSMGEDVDNEQYEQDRRDFKSQIQKKISAPIYASFHSTVEVYGTDLLTAQILIYNDVRKAFDTYFINEETSLFSSRSALSAHQNLSYTAFKNDMSSTAQLFEKELENFSIWGVSVRMASRVFLNSTLSMPNRVSATQLVQHGVEKDTFFTDVNYCEENIENISSGSSSMPRAVALFSGMIEAIRKGDDPLSYFEEEHKSEFSYVRAPLYLNRPSEFSQNIKKGDDAYKAAALCGEETLSNQGRKASFRAAVTYFKNKDKDDRERTRVINALANRMSGRVTAVRMGPTFPGLNNDDLSKPLFALSEFAQVFQLVLNLTTSFADVIDELIDVDRRRNSQNQSIAVYEAGAKNFINALQKGVKTELFRLRLRVGRVYASLQSYRNWAQAGFQSKLDFETSLVECFQLLRVYSNYKCGTMAMILYACFLCTKAAEDDLENEQTEQTELQASLFRIKKTVNHLRVTSAQYASKTNDELIGEANNVLNNPDSARWIDEAVENMKISSNVYANAVLLNLLNPLNGPARCMGAFYGKDSLPLSPANVEFDNDDPNKEIIASQYPTLVDEDHNEVHQANVLYKEKSLVPDVYALKAC
jgi:hypothetical protein